MGADSSQTASQGDSTTITEGAQAFHRLTGFQRDLLVAIAGFEHPSGQDIKTKLEARTGNEITHGRLYPNLDTLVTEGFVEKGEIDRRTNYYAIAETGRDALTQYAEWIETRADR